MQVRPVNPAVAVVFSQSIEDQMGGKPPQNCDLRKALADTQKRRHNPNGLFDIVQFLLLLPHMAEFR